ncbi:hypothetical protein CS8_036040 [Cupriavidus sp. 8B]
MPGIEVRLISPQYVAPFVKTNKNDRNDAEAIVEAASRPAMRFVTVKSVQQQDIQAAHRMRAIPLRHRTALINQMRGLLGEHGHAIARSPEAFKRAISELLRTSDDELTAFCQTLATGTMPGPEADCLVTGGTIPARQRQCRNSRLRSLSRG